MTDSHIRLLLVEELLDPLLRHSRIVRFSDADARFALFDGTGAMLLGGRWNSPGLPVIYASETFAGAILEILVHSNLGRVPRTHALIEIEVPDKVTIEVVTKKLVPVWNSVDSLQSRVYGDKWLRERRSVAMLTPSIVTGGRERNLAINPLHPEFSKITTSRRPAAIDWDKRLFRP